MTSAAVLAAILGLYACGYMFARRCLRGMPLAPFVVLIIAGCVGAAQFLMHVMGLHLPHGAAIYGTAAAVAGACMRQWPRPR
jgi:hypothetical protein